MKKRIIMILLVAFIIGTISACSGKNNGEDVTTEGGQEEGSYLQITQDEAKKMMGEEGNYIILDVRTESEYAEGHIPDAICIPNETIDENITEQLQDQEQVILVYCRSGNRSKQASEKLANLGYSNIYEFGGINTWAYDIVQ